MRLRVLAILLLLLAGGALAANNPGHDTLYVEEQGNSTLNGSLNISNDLRVAQRMFADYLDIRGDGTLTGNNRIIGGNGVLRIESTGTIYMNNDISGGEVRIGRSGLASILNVSGTIYQENVKVCLQNGTNCPAALDGATGYTKWRLGSNTGTIADITNNTLVNITAGTGISTTLSGSTITIANTGDTNAGDDLTTSSAHNNASTSDINVSGAYNALNLQIGAGKVGASELATTITLGSGQVLNYGAGTINASLLANQNSGYYLNRTGFAATNITSGVLAITYGGTGSNSAAGARGNLSAAANGTCPSGQFVQNATTGSVQCATPPSGADGTGGWTNDSTSTRTQLQTIINSSAEAGSLVVRNESKIFVLVNGSNGWVGIGTATPNNLLQIHDNGISTWNTGLTMNFNALDIYGIQRSWNGAGSGNAITHFSPQDIMFAPGVAVPAYGGSATGGQKVTFAATGNVGIGTLGPNSTLTVVSSNPNGSLHLQNQSGSTHLFVNGSSGYIGIGHSTPAYEVDMNGSINLRHGGYIFGKAQQGTGASAYLMIYNGSSGETRLWNSFANSVLIIGINNSERMRITPSGKVGINTSSPAQTLEVVGTINSTGPLYAPQICLAGSCQTAWPSGGYTQWRVGNNGNVSAVANDTLVNITAGTGISVVQVGTGPINITIINSGDTNAGDDLTTSSAHNNASTSDINVSGAYNALNLQIGGGKVGASELASTITLGASQAINYGAGTINASLFANQNSGYYLNRTGFAATNITSGALAIANGGTGSNSAAGARGNLSAAANGTCPSGQFVQNATSGSVQCAAPPSTADGTGGWTNDSTTTSTSLIMNVNNNAVLFNGTTGATPASGAGTRMMWIPAKSAFRAGRVSGTQWDDAQIYKGSVGFGEDISPNGNYTFYVGRNITAGADYVHYTAAFGESHAVSVADHSLIAGHAHTVNVANYALIAGQGNTVGNHGVTFGGANSNAMSHSSILGGYGNTINGNGLHSVIPGGWINSVAGTASMAFGHTATANGNYSIALGNYVSANRNWSYVIGSGTRGGSTLNNNIQDSLMIGFNSATPTLFVNGSDVGISTTTPTQKLDVNGSVNISGTSAKLHTPELCLNGNCQTVWPSADGTGGWTNTSTTTITQLQTIINSSAQNGALIVQNQTGTTHFFINGSSGKIGIGTNSTTGSQLYMLSGLGGSTTPMAEFEQTSTSDPSLLFDSDGNEFAIGIDSSDSDKFKISDNTALGTNDRFTIDSNGQIAVNHSTPQAAMDIRGTLLVNNSALNGALRVVNTTGSMQLFVNGSSGYVGIGTNTPKVALHLNTTSSNGRELRISSSMPGLQLEETDQAADSKKWEIISSGGDVLISTKNDADSSLTTYVTLYRATGILELSSLTVQSTSNLARLGAYNVTIGTSEQTQKVSVNGSVNISGTGSKLYAPEICLAGSCQTSWPAGGSGSGGWTNNSQNTSTTLNVGIGTTAPISPLHVYSATNANLTLETDGAFNYASLNVKSVTANVELVANGFAQIGLVGTTNEYPLSIRTNSTEAIRILTNGNVGINTNNAQQRLDVNGNIATAGTTRISSTGVGTFASGTTINGQNVCLANGVNCPSASGDGTGGWTNTTTETRTLLNMTVQNGAVLFNGTIGATPISGAGTRFMWVPAKGALRAGVASGTEWDDAYIAPNSIALGHSSYANASNAIALGNASWATGPNSIAMAGANTFGDYGVAAGVGATAAENWSIAFGYGAYAAAPYATAIGPMTTAAHYYAVAMGVQTYAMGAGSFAAGGFTNASGNYATAFGHTTRASGFQSFANGFNSTASGDRSFASGEQAHANGHWSGAWGANINASGNGAYIIGTGTAWNNQLNNTLNHSLMIGFLSNTPTMFVNGTGTSFGTTTTPTNVYIYESSSSTTPMLEIEQASAGDPSLLFDSDGNEFAIGIDSSDSDKFKISDNAAGLGTNDRFTIDSNGQIAVNHSTPQAAMDIRGTLLVNNSALNGALRVVNTTGTTHLSINGSSGYVGIGTTNPNSPLDVSKTITTNDEASQIRLIIPGGNSNTAHSQMAFYGARSSVSHPIFFLRAQYNVDGTWADRSFMLYGQSYTGAGDYAPLLTVKDSGNVGIGTTNPTSMLHVGSRPVWTRNMSTVTIGNTSSAQMHLLALDTGSAAYNDIVGNAWYNGSAWELYNYAHDAWSINMVSAGSNTGWFGIGHANNGTPGNGAIGSWSQYLYITGVGNVGIGTTTPNTTLSISSANNPNAAGWPSVWLSGDTNKERIIITSTSAAVFGAYQNRGTAASPTAIQTGDSLGYFQLGGYNGSSFSRAAWISGVATENWGGNSWGGAMTFATVANNSGSTIVERMRINENGNVGIGTTSPGALLDVRGSIKAGTTTNTVFDAVPTIMITNATQATYIVAAQNGTHGIQMAWIANSDASLTYGRITTQGHLRPVMIGNSWAYFNNDGNVGIGTTSPQKALHVTNLLAGNYNSQYVADNPSGIPNTGAGMLFAARNSNDNLTYYGGIMAAVQSNTSGAESGVLIFRAMSAGAITNVGGFNGTTLGVGTLAPNEGKIEVKGGSVCVDTNSDNSATSCIASESDARLKQNITQIDDALAKIKQLRGVTFDWRTNDPEVLAHYPLIARFNDSPHSIGLIAQEVAPVLPEAIMLETIGDNTTQYLQLDYDKITPVLVEGIKEQQAQIEQLGSTVQNVSAGQQQLETELDTLKAENAQLREQLDAIEARLVALESR